MVFPEGPSLHPRPPCTAQVQKCCQGLDSACSPESQSASAHSLSRCLLSLYHVWTWCLGPTHKGVKTHKYLLGRKEPR